MALDGRSRRAASSCGRRADATRRAGNATSRATPWRDAPRSRARRSARIRSARRRPGGRGDGEPAREFPDPGRAPGHAGDCPAARGTGSVARASRLGCRARLAREPAAAVWPRALRHADFHVRLRRLVPLGLAKLHQQRSAHSRRGRRMVAASVPSAPGGSNASRSSAGSPSSPPWPCSLPRSCIASSTGCTWSSKTTPGRAAGRGEPAGSRGYAGGEGRTTRP